MSEQFPQSDPFNVTAAHKSFYHEHRWIKLKNVLSQDEISFYNQAISAEVTRLNRESRPLNERDTYGKAFLQITNLWRQNEVVKSLVFSRRLAGICAELMEVDSIRLYHDQALFKEAGGGYTPWHADQYYWPLASEKTITAWIPLQKTPLEMGALEFSSGSHQLTEGRELAISDDSEAVVSKALRNRGFEHIVEPFDLGEVSFHSGWTYHRASPNTLPFTRKVMCIIYMEGTMRLSQPTNKHQELDREVWCPGAKVGEIIDTPLNPLIFERL